MYVFLTDDAADNPGEESRSVRKRNVNFSHNLFLPHSLYWN